MVVLRGQMWEVTWECLQVTLKNVKMSHLKIGNERT